MIEARVLLFTYHLELTVELKVEDPSQKNCFLMSTTQNQCLNTSNLKRFYGHVLVQVFFKLCLRRILRQEHKIVRSPKVVLLAVYQVLYKTVVKGKPLVKVLFFWVVVEFLDFVKSGGLF